MSRIVDVKDYRGDHQIDSVWSDGVETIAAGNGRGIENGSLLDFVDSRLRFLDDADESVGLLAAHALANRAEDLLKPRRLPIGFLRVTGEGVLKLFVGRRLRQLGQGFQ